MIHQEIVKRFCEHVNTHKELDFQWLHIDSNPVQDNQENIKNLIEDLKHTYQDALNPLSFYNVRVQGNETRLRQCYALLNRTFSSIELDTLEVHLDYMKSSEDQQHLSPMIMIGRYWQTLGSQLYDDQGKLIQFHYDPLTTSEHLAAVVSGSYMSMSETGSPGESIGVMSHLVTREGFRRKYGHGTSLMQAFERDVYHIAANRDEHPALILLEAQQQSLQFWYNHGYRWPAKTRYAQPPLEFDPVTGEHLYDPVPEILMVKMLGARANTYIDVTLLKRAVQTMYNFWFLSALESYPPEAQEKARAYIDEVFADFVSSLPEEPSTILLTDPPAMKS